jgi:hypothetical protein
MGGDLFECCNCREFSVPSTWPHGNSGLCAELRRRKLDPHVTDRMLCVIDRRELDRVETARRVREIIEGGVNGRRE